MIARHHAELVKNLGRRDADAVVIQINEAPLAHKMNADAFVEARRCRAVAPLSSRAAGTHNPNCGWFGGVFLEGRRFLPNAPSAVWVPAFAGMTLWVEHPLDARDVIQGRYERGHVSCGRAYGGISRRNAEV